MGTVAGGVAVAAAPTAGRARGSEAAATRRAAPGGLADPAFRPLPLGAIRPAGWLQRQLRIQADGLSGHLDEFWPDVGEEQVVRRRRRGLGARPLLARRGHPARAGSSTTGR